MKVSVDELRMKIVEVVALVRAVADGSTRLKPDKATEEVQSLAFLADESASEALTAVSLLLSSL